MNHVIDVKGGVADRIIVFIEQFAVPVQRRGRGELPVNSGIAQRYGAESHLRHPEITLGGRVSSAPEANAIEAGGAVILPKSHGAESLHTSFCNSTSRVVRSAS